MNISNQLMSILPLVEKPGRYTGGEYGAVTKKTGTNLLVALSFPDLYEIGMSNLAIKILYNLLNSLEQVTCERVFAPAPDMEELLRARQLPLFSLESGRPLHEFDIIGFSVGYELTATNLLTILELGGITLEREQRGEEEPLVLAGGPAVTNPLPLSRFIDFAFIGEAEDFLRTHFPRLAVSKRQGASRRQLREEMAALPGIWRAGQGGQRVRRVLNTHFPTQTAITQLPVPNIKVVQDQGNVEIMRGCPNGCRFCHASVLYRPYRLKQPLQIDTEVQQQIFEGGYREITLASLSTGDYPRLSELVTLLDARYHRLGISFSLPSLRINSLSLEIMQKISRVRKSGLTFAVETPETTWQRGLNKEVCRAKIIQLLKEAQQKGWRQAKFYFMIGLPVYTEDETQNILDFLYAVQQATKMKLHINISTFVPKPHTPFQWAAQLNEEEALQRIHKLKGNLVGKGFKVGYHSPFASVLEGLLAMGDERMGDLLLEAYRQGARLDAWEEHLDRKLWRRVLAGAPSGLLDTLHNPRDPSLPLPWADIDLGVSGAYLQREWQRAGEARLSEPCALECREACGVCNKTIRVSGQIDYTALQQAPAPPFPAPSGQPVRLLLGFSKEGRAVFLSHLNCMTLFERAWLRAGYAVQFTEGFNPKPRLEFAQPLPLGLAAREECLLATVLNFDSAADVIRKLNLALPQGVRITRVKRLQPYLPGTKKISLGKIFWGADYLIEALSEVAKLQMLARSIEAEGKASYPEALEDFTVDDSGLGIRWKQVSKKGYNIIRFIEKMSQWEDGSAAVLSHFRITRVTPLARDNQGHIADFFTVMQ